MHDTHDRTEQATPRRRARAAAEGQSSRSPALVSALALLAAGLPCWLAAGKAHETAALLTRAAAAAAHAARDASSASVVVHAVRGSAAPLFTELAGVVAIAAAAALAASVASAIACGPFVPTLRTLQPRIERLSLVAGARRMFSRDALMQTLIATLSAALVLWCFAPAAGRVIKSAGADLTFSQQASLAGEALREAWTRTALAAIVIAGADIVAQRRRHAKALRMTPRELRDERAETEGRPEVRTRRRSVGARRARGLKLLAVRRATAVVTNPTHLAVALRYAPPSIDVPIVVARGADHAAAALRALAEIHDVPIIESPELAHALYARVDLDDAIPEECYAAVAAIFAWLLRTRGELGGA